MMKRFILPLLICLLLSRIAFGNPVDTTVAKIVAENFYKKQLSLQNQTKSLLLEDSEMHLVNIEVAGSGTLKSASVSCFYVFNVSNNGGFVIVSAESSTVPVLGYSLTGQYDENGEIPEALNEWLAKCKNQIVEIKLNDIAPSENTEQEWSELYEGNTLKTTEISESISPLLTTTWNQGCYYNSQCPVDTAGYCGHTLVGCVGVAIGQIMKYWNYPVADNAISGYLSSEYGDIPAIPFVSYGWDNMPDELTEESSDAQNNAVSTLLYHCAVALKTDFGVSSSSALLSGVDEAFVDGFSYSPYLQYLKKEDYSDSDWDSLLKNELSNGRPVFYSGGTHAFVCDGYQSDDYFHFNWGWSGAYDGYFYLNDLTPFEGISYNSNQVAIVGIQPVGDEDITVSDASVLSAGSAPIGDVVSVQSVQKYSGSSTSVPDVFLYCYLSVDTILSSSDILLSSDNSSTINADNTSETEKNTFTIPDGIEGGDYYVLFVGDATNVINESNEDNNIAYAGIYIDAAVEMTYVPDDNFEQALIDLGYDSGNLNDSVPTLNIRNVASLNISNKNIADLTGIEGFSSLTKLICDNNDLTEINVGGNTALLKLSVWFNKLTSLDLSSNAGLTYIDCGYNKLTSFNIGENVKLKTIYCNNNNISAINTVSNTNLYILSCIGNKISSLNLSENTNLRYLYCNDNELEALDLSSNVKLERLRCNGNVINGLDLSNNVKLEDLYCKENNIGSLEVGNNAGLVNLNCSGNEIVSLDVSENTSLVFLDCSNNELSSLTLKSGNNAALDEMDATNNRNLTCIEVDDTEAVLSYDNWKTDTSAVYAATCPGASSTQLTDVSSYDSEETEVSVYPSPSLGQVFVDCGNVSGQAELSVYKINGQKILSRLYDSPQNIDVDISNQSNGLYLVELKTVNSRIVKKVVLKK